MMEIKHLKITMLVALVSCTFFLAPTQVNAANYSKSEAKQVRYFQNRYKKLSKKVYDENNLYTVEPNFAEPFNPGQLKAAYITTSMDYVNYYRKLCGLPSESNNDKVNRDAQIGASALAAINAKTSLTAHGLLGYTRPYYISEDEWDTAEDATLGNINFLESDTGASAGEIVTDLIKDDNNLDGSGNTGHRALILSARATRMGIGAAYGSSNKKFYSVQNGVFADDILRPAVKDVVAFPSSGVFPYELLDSDTPWSIYFAKRRLTRQPKIYVTDLTTNKKKRAIHVRNYGTDYFGDGYTSAISFDPNISLINTHKYKVEIRGVTSYSFRLFRQKDTLKSPKKVVHKTTQHSK